MAPEAEISYRQAESIRRMVGLNGGRTIEAWRHLGIAGEIYEFDGGLIVVIEDRFGGPVSKPSRFRVFYGNQITEKIRETIPDANLPIAKS